MTNLVRLGNGRNESALGSIPNTTEELTVFPAVMGVVTRFVPVAVEILFNLLFGQVTSTNRHDGVVLIFETKALPFEGFLHFAAGGNKHLVMLLVCIPPNLLFGARLGVDSDDVPVFVLERLTLELPSDIGLCYSTIHFLNPFLIFYIYYTIKIFLSQPGAEAPGTI